VQSTFSALTHGTSGLLFGYLCVLIPLLAGLIRRHAPASGLSVAPVFSVPSALIAAVVVAIASPLLRVIGISNDSVLQVVFGIAAFIAVGYATGCLLARARTSGSSYRRGAFVAHENSIDEPPQTRHPRRAAEVSDSNASLSLAGIRIAMEDETKHFKFIGTTGQARARPFGRFSVLRWPGETAPS